jgi:hypothetical protein
MTPTNKSEPLSLISSAREAMRLPTFFSSASARRPTHAAQPALPRRPSRLPSLFFLSRSLVGRARMSGSLPTSSRGSAAPSMAAGRYWRVSRASPAFKLLHQAVVKPLFTLPQSIGNFPS